MHLTVSVNNSSIVSWVDPLHVVVLVKPPLHVMDWLWTRLQQRDQLKIFFLPFSLHHGFQWTYSNLHHRVGSINQSRFRKASWTRVESLLPLPACLWHVLSQPGFLDPCPNPLFEHSLYLLQQVLGWHSVSMFIFTAPTYILWLQLLCPVIQAQDLYRIVLCVLYVVGNGGICWDSWNKGLPLFSKQTSVCGRVANGFFLI